MLDSAGRKAVLFNWALDWFDARLATETISRDRPALWIVEPDRRAQVELSFAEHFAPSESSRELLRDLGLKRNDRFELESALVEHAAVAALTRSLSFSRARRVPAPGDGGDDIGRGAAVS
jgi:hypothetical protein